MQRWVAELRQDYSASNLLDVLNGEADVALAWQASKLSSARRDSRMTSVPTPCRARRVRSPPSCAEEEILGACLPEECAAPSTSPASLSCTPVKPALAKVGGRLRAVWEPALECARSDGQQCTYESSCSSVVTLGPREGDDRAQPSSASTSAISGMRPHSAPRMCSFAPSREDSMPTPRFASSTRGLAGAAMAAMGSANARESEGEEWPSPVPVPEPAPCRRSRRGSSSSNIGLQARFEALHHEAEFRKQRRSVAEQQNRFLEERNVGATPGRARPQARSASECREWADKKVMQQARKEMNLQARREQEARERDDQEKRECSFAPQLAGISKKQRQSARARRLLAEMSKRQQFCLERLEAIKRSEGQLLACLAERKAEACRESYPEAAALEEAIAALDAQRALEQRRFRISRLQILHELSRVEGEARTAAAQLDDGSANVASFIDACAFSVAEVQGPQCRQSLAELADASTAANVAVVPTPGAAPHAPSRVELIQSSMFGGFDPYLASRLEEECRALTRLEEECRGCYPEEMTLVGLLLPPPVPSAVQLGQLA